MELLLELFLTVSLSLIFTSLFIKLFSMNHVNNTTTDKDHHLTEETTLLQMDKFQWVPFEEEVIKLEEREVEGKSKVEFHTIVGVEKEDGVVQGNDVVVVGSKEVDDEINSLEQVVGGEGESGPDSSVNTPSDRNDRDLSFVSEESKMCEIEIESAEEVEYDDGNDMGDWEEIGIKDFEELLGSKAGLYIDVTSTNSV